MLSRVRLLRETGELHPPAIKVGFVVLHTSVILQPLLRKAVSCNISDQTMSCNNREDRVIIEKKIMKNILCNIRKWVVLVFPSVSI
jgi:hypothetical protein